MDENTLSYLNIQFTKSHTDGVLIASLIPQRWQSQDQSQFQRSFYMCTPLKMRCVAILSHGNGQPMQGTPSMTPQCSPLPTLGGSRRYLKTAATSAMCYSPALHETSQRSLSWIKGLPAPKTHHMRARTAQNAHCWGHFFHEWCQGKALVSSLVKQSLGRTLEMTQPGIL